MKTLVMLGFVVSLWMLLTLQSLATPLQIVTLEQPPLEYEEDGAIKGIAVDIVNEAFARMQQPVTLKLYPFARAMEMMKTGETDAIFAIVKTAERELFLDYPSEALIEQTATLFVRKNDPIQFQGDLQELRDYRFGIIRGATYGEKWKEAVSTGVISKIEMVTDYRQNVLKLADNRIDAMIGPRLTILYVAKELGQQDAIKELATIEIVPTYLTFSKTRLAPAIKEQFERILKELKSDGTYDKIIQAYIQ